MLKPAIGQQYAPENWINTSYSLGDKLGEGGFGIVRRAVHLLTGENVAIKIMNKAKLGKDLQHIYQEIATMKDLMHQNICRLYQVVETKREIFLVLEYCEQGEMFDYIVTKSKLPEDEARYFFRQLVQAIAYTHKQGYVHRDLKPENLLLKGESRRLKVIDFGLSSESGHLLDTFCGSLCYASPEIIMNRPYNGPAADIWSMGVLLFILVTGTAPFNSDDQRKISHAITHGIYKVPNTLSRECQDLIQGMLTVDVSKRMRMDAIMVHPWIMEGHNNMLKATSVYQRDIFDQDVVTEIAMNKRKTPKDVISQLGQWDFDYDTATYLALLHKKENNGVCILSSCKEKKTVVNSPTHHASLDRNEYDAQTNKRETEALFGNSKQKVLHGSSANAQPEFVDKENVRPPASKSHSSDSGYQSNNAFNTPKRHQQGIKPIGVQRAGSLPRPVIFRDNNKPAMIPVIRFRQPDSKQQSPIINLPVKTSSDTPPTTTIAEDTRFSRSNNRHLVTRKPRIVSSLERGSQRVFDLLTPRRMKKDNSQVKVCKNYVNVSVTNSESPEHIRTEITRILEGLGFEVTHDGWKVRAENKSNKFKVQFDIVSIEHLGKIGLKRKRIKGEGFLYKEICQQILQL